MDLIEVPAADLHAPRSPLLEFGVNYVNGLAAGPGGAVVVAKHGRGLARIAGDPSSSCNFEDVVRDAAR